MRVPIRPGSRSYMTAPCNRRTKTSARWPQSICATGWRCGASRAALPRVLAASSCRLSAAFYIQIDIDRNVVGGLVPSAHMAVDAGIDQPVRRLRRQQQMVNADTVVLDPCAGLIVPKSIEVRFITYCTYCIG